MKKLMNKAQMEMVKVMIKGRAILSGNSGEGMVDSAVKILISIVIGALLLAGLYALFGDVILPTLRQRIQDMFNFSGGVS
ncbi:hypothetical protein F8154_04255 [Alkaliphilus pronyensis]|uniref:Uncharacterized protein n=1 Tax=Alkaliphilus pronyensis TaxID=1482732 RepID=A0A6I0FCJ8_9FIRM|nr:DUF6133 family protein [Alkaliphilus pronyensis]KAB3536296.1 hypothetical protein F8154_04255 [Alkaliphilus pronyensis]